jgi:hypothetical protein
MGGWGSNPCLAVSGPIRTYFQIRQIKFKGTRLRLFRHQFESEFQIVPYGRMEPARRG